MVWGLGSNAFRYGSRPRENVVDPLGTMNAAPRCFIAHKWLWERSENSPVMSGYIPLAGWDLVRAGLDWSSPYSNNKQSVNCDATMPHSRRTTKLNAAVLYMTLQYASDRLMLVLKGDRVAANGQAAKESPSKNRYEIPDVHRHGGQHAAKGSVSGRDEQHSGELTAGTQHPQ